MCAGQGAAGPHERERRGGRSAGSPSGCSEATATASRAVAPIAAAQTNRSAGAEQLKARSESA